MKPNQFYPILKVEQIEASIRFYQKLGFTPIEGQGSPAENWILLKNGSSLIGLYQDMFPRNILAIEVSDARSQYHLFKSKEIEIATWSKIDHPSGPCHFSIIDPDGNSILFNQSQ